jgi:murein endopeptidase
VVRAPLALALAVLLLLLVAPAADAACRSRALGETNHGRLACGVQLPGETDALVTWDFPLARSPNRGWRRWGTQKLIDTVELISLDYGTRFPIGPRLVVGDLSRRHGGPFREEYGGVGHASHQNGLDVDIYYPRSDGLEIPPIRPSQIDRRRAQWLVDRVARGARFVFIGPNTGLKPPGTQVQFLPSYHDNHLHLRIWP